MFHEKIRNEAPCGIFDSIALRASFEAGGCVLLASVSGQTRWRFLLGGGLMVVLCILRSDIVVRFGGCLV